MRNERYEYQYVSRGCHHETNITPHSFSQPRSTHLLNHLQQRRKTASNNLMVSPRDARSQYLAKARLLEAMDLYHQPQPADRHDVVRQASLSLPWRTLYRLRVAGVSGAKSKEQLLRLPHLCDVGRTPEIPMRSPLRVSRTAKTIRDRRILVSAVSSVRLQAHPDL